MEQYLTDRKKASIKNAVKSLYQVIILVEEDNHLCHVVDSDGEFQNFDIDKVKVYDDLFMFLFKNTHPEDRENLTVCMNLDEVNDALSKQVYISLECRIRHRDSKYYWSNITICNSSAEDSTMGSEYLFLIQDIHGSKDAMLTQYNELVSAIDELNEKYNKLFIENMTDAQTGCYNRKGLKYFEAIALKDAMDSNKNLFVCVLDLNGLKYLNDTFGHGAGDTALSVVADALKKASPEGASIVRTGGDEFLVFCALDKDSREPEEFGTILEAELTSYNDSHDNPFKVSASYGFEFLPAKENMESLDEYIETADEKMYRMKEKTDPYKR